MARSPFITMFSSSKYEFNAESGRSIYGLEKQLLFVFFEDVPLFATIPQILLLLFMSLNHKSIFSKASFVK